MKAGARIDTDALLAMHPHAKEIRVPVLKPQPSLLDCVAMATGRLADWSFGKPTDAVVDDVSIPLSRRHAPAPEQA